MELSQKLLWEDNNISNCACVCVCACACACVRVWRVYVCVCVCVNAGTYLPDGLVVGPDVTSVAGGGPKVEVDAAQELYNYSPSLFIIHVM